MAQSTATVAVEFTHPYRTMQRRKCLPKEGASAEKCGFSFSRNKAISSLDEAAAALPVRAEQRNTVLLLFDGGRGAFRGGE